MMRKPRYEKPQWTLEFLTRGRIKVLDRSHVRRVGEEACVAVRGRLTHALPVRYVLMKEGTGRFQVTLMTQVDRLTDTPESEVRLPQAGAFLFSASPSVIDSLRCWP